MDKSRGALPLTEFHPPKWHAPSPCPHHHFHTFALPSPSLLLVLLLLRYFPPSIGGRLGHPRCVGSGSIQRVPSEFDLNFEITISMLIFNNQYETGGPIWMCDYNGHTILDVVSIKQLGLFISSLEISNPRICYDV